MKKIVMLGTDWTSPGGITAVITSYKDGGLFNQWPVVLIPTYRTANPFNKLWMAIRAFAVLFWLLMTQQVAIVHAHSASRASFWRKACLLSLAHFFGVKTIFHLHSGEFADFFHKECSVRKQNFIRNFLRKMDCVIVLTERWKGILEGIVPGIRLAVLANPIEVFNHPTHAISRRVLFLGRLRNKKGVYDLVNSIPLLVDKYPDVVFVLAGDGELDQVAQQAKELGVSNNIELTGWISGRDKDQQLASADLFILPSYFEGLPVCILEAMAWKIPVVATNVGGIPDICQDKVDGLLIPAGDPAAIATAIDRIFSDSHLRNMLVESAFKRVNAEFEMTVVLDKLGFIYQEILEK